ncbi:MAG TPA: hypothetical protein VGH50_05235 [Candidatus Binatia bacterium]
MELRNHPLMSFLTRRSWPPVWSWIGGKRDQYATGEVGVLREVRMHEGESRKVFLLIDHDERLYMGCLLLDDTPFARAVYDLLEKHRGERIEDIGRLDVDHLL